MLVGYLAAVRLCLLAARDGGRGLQMRRERRLWRDIAIGLIILAIYRQCDLVQLVTGLGRTIAAHGQWYATRHAYQVAIIWTIAALVLAGAGVIALRLRAVDPLALIALAGVGALVLLMSVDAVSLHQLDAFFRRSVGGVTIYQAAEAGTIATVSAAALAHRRRAMARLRA